MNRGYDNSPENGGHFDTVKRVVAQSGFTRTIQQNPRKIAAGVAAFALACQSIFIVTPNERANVRFMGGETWYSQPLTSGPHLKIPFLDRVDKIQTALKTLNIDTIDVGTIDNQRVKLDINFNYVIPDDRVNFVMYKVGRAGNSDIESQVKKTVESVTVDIFAVQNMNNVNGNLGLIRAQIQKEVSRQLYDLYGIQTKSLQISKITPSDAFIESNENAVREKNKAIAAENAVVTKKAVAEGLVAEETGKADAAIQDARGHAESVRLTAEAEKTRLTLEGQGEQSNISMQVKALGSADKYIAFLHAKAGLNWKGDVPQTIVGTGGKGSSNIVIPVPTTVAGGPR